MRGGAGGPRRLLHLVLREVRVPRLQATDQERGADSSLVAEVVVTAPASAASDTILTVESGVQASAHPLAFPPSSEETDFAREMLRGAVISQSGRGVNDAEAQAQEQEHSELARPERARLMHEVAHSLSDVPEQAPNTDGRAGAYPTKQQKPAGRQQHP